VGSIIGFGCRARVRFAVDQVDADVVKLGASVLIDASHGVDRHLVKLLYAGSRRGDVQLESDDEPPPRKRRRAPTDVGLPATRRRPIRVSRRQVLSENPDDLVTDLFRVGVKLEQDPVSDALLFLAFELGHRACAETDAAIALVNEAEQKVLGADVGVAKAQRLAQRDLEHFLGARRERDLTRGRSLARSTDLPPPRGRALARW
jgi:hypothetical protein